MKICFFAEIDPRDKNVSLIPVVYNGQKGLDSHVDEETNVVKPAAWNWPESAVGLGLKRMDETINTFTV